MEDRWYKVPANTDGFPDYVDNHNLKYVGAPLDGDADEEHPERGATKWLIRVYGPTSDLDAFGSETGVATLPDSAGKGVEEHLNSRYDGHLPATDKAGWEGRVHIINP